VTHGEHYEAVTWVRGDGADEDTGWWRAGSDFRVGSKDRARAKDLQRDTVTFASKTLGELMKKAGIDVERIDLLCSVEPRGWVPPATLEVLGLSPELASSVYATRGHLGACGPIANLDLAYRSGRVRGLTALYGQGAGFTRAAALLSMD
jgi:3-oxoacyl-[acyl-carrier-protein] synthase III